jgi:DNA-directed RNA polymerase specialized sigma24 family protein
MTNNKISNRKSAYSSEELKVLFLKGSPENFSLIYDLYAARVYGFIFTTLNIKEDAQTILLKTFTKAYKDRENFSHFQFGLLTWLMGIAAKLCLEEKTPDETKKIKENIRKHFLAQRMVVAE